MNTMKEIEFLIDELKKLQQKARTGKELNWMEHQKLLILTIGVFDTVPLGIMNSKEIGMDTFDAVYGDSYDSFFENEFDEYNEVNE